MYDKTHYNKKINKIKEANELREFCWHKVSEIVGVSLLEVNKKEGDTVGQDYCFQKNK